MKRRYWTKDDIALLRRLYPHTATEEIARRLGRPMRSVYFAASRMGLRKSAALIASLAARSKLHVAGRPYRFAKGHVPFNKGMKGWHSGGRSVDTQFKKGSYSKRWDPEIYCVGALRINADGYIDMKVKPGSRSWRALHVILWEDAHGPVPRGHVIRFKDGDKMNVALKNLKLMSRARNMLRNTIHNLPRNLRDTILVLGKLKRRLREKQDRRSAQSPV